MNASAKKPVPITPDVTWTLERAQAERLHAILMKVAMPAEQTLDLIIGLRGAMQGLTPEKGDGP